MLETFDFGSSPVFFGWCWNFEMPLPAGLGAVRYRLSHLGWDLFIARWLLPWLSPRLTGGASQCVCLFYVFFAFETTISEGESQFPNFGCRSLGGNFGWIYTSLQEFEKAHFFWEIENNIFCWWADFCGFEACWWEKISGIHTGQTWYDPMDLVINDTTPGHHGSYHSHSVRPWSTSRSAWVWNVRMELPGEKSTSCFFFLEKTTQASTRTW